MYGVCIKNLAKMPKTIQSLSQFLRNNKLNEFDIDISTVHAMFKELWFPSQAKIAGFLADKESKFQSIFMNDRETESSEGVLGIDALESFVHENLVEGRVTRKDIPNCQWRAVERGQIKEYKKGTFEYTIALTATVIKQRGYSEEGIPINCLDTGEILQRKVRLYKNLADIKEEVDLEELKFDPLSIISHDVLPEQDFKTAEYIKYKMAGKIAEQLVGKIREENCMGTIGNILVKHSIIGIKRNALGYSKGYIKQNETINEYSQIMAESALACTLVGKK